MVVTGAGMSGLSGVPVFRHSDGSMSSEFLGYLDNFNRARRQAGLCEVRDWFEFSVPDMFARKPK